MVEIEVTKIKLIEEAGALKAVCDVQLDGWVGILGIKIVQKEGRKPYPYMPQAAWVDRSGRPHYEDALSFPQEVQEEINRIVLKAFTEKVEEKNA